MREWWRRSRLRLKRIELRRRTWINCRDAVASGWDGQEWRVCAYQGCNAIECRAAEDGWAAYLNACAEEGISPR